MNRRLRAWLAQWGPVLPLLIAESTIWLGFGALLPILPLYFTAARRRPADARRRGGGLAGRAAHRRADLRLARRPGRRGADDDHRAPAGLGVRGAAAVHRGAGLRSSSCAPCRASPRRCTTRRRAPTSSTRTRPSDRARRSGSTARRRPAASCSGRRSAALAAAVTGQPEVVFWVAGITLLVSATLVALRVPELPHLRAALPGGAASGGAAPGPPEPVPAWRGPGRTTRQARGPATHGGLARPACATRCSCRRSASAMGTFFAGGSYEVVWSLYMTSLGADLAASSGSRFVAFAPAAPAPVAVHRPLHRPLGWLPRARGGHRRASRSAASCTRSCPSVWWVVVLGLVEGTAFALASPALYLLVARAAPAGRSSTAQGLLGGAGTLGTIVASLAAGIARGHRPPAARSTSSVSWAGRAGDRARASAGGACTTPCSRDSPNGPAGRGPIPVPSPPRL